jgi:hypothetical protein
MFRFAYHVFFGLMVRFFIVVSTISVVKYIQFAMEGYLDSSGGLQYGFIFFLSVPTLVMLYIIDLILWSGSAKKRQTNEENTLSPYRALYEITWIEKIYVGAIIFIPLLVALIAGIIDVFADF